MGQLEVSEALGEIISPREMEGRMKREGNQSRTLGSRNILSGRLE